MNEERDLVRELQKLAAEADARGDNHTANTLYVASGELALLRGFQQGVTEAYKKPAEWIRSRGKRGE